MNEKTNYGRSQRRKYEIVRGGGEMRSETSEIISENIRTGRAASRFPVRAPLSTIYFARDISRKLSKSKFAGSFSRTEILAIRWRNLVTITEQLHAIKNVKSFLKNERKFAKLCSVETAGTLSKLCKDDPRYRLLRTFYIALFRKRSLSCFLSSNC